MDQFGNPFNPSDAQVINEFLLPHLMGQPIPPGMIIRDIFNISPLALFQDGDFPVQQPVFFISERKFHGRNSSRSAPGGTWNRQDRGRRPIPGNDGNVMGYFQRFVFVPDIGGAGWSMTEFTDLEESNILICKVNCDRAPNMNINQNPDH